MRKNWSRDEVEATVADYFGMLELELSGQHYNKTMHRNSLLKLLDERTPLKRALAELRVFDGVNE